MKKSEMIEVLANKTGLTKADCEKVFNATFDLFKDSDGNIAKKEMGGKIGTEYEVSLRDREMPVDSKITKVGEN